MERRRPLVLRDSRVRVRACVCVAWSGLHGSGGPGLGFSFAGDLGIAAGLASYVAPCAYMTGGVGGDSSYCWLWLLLPLGAGGRERWVPGGDGGAGMRRPGACRDLCRQGIFSDPKNPGFQGTCPPLTPPPPRLVECGAAQTGRAGRMWKRTPRNLFSGRSPSPPRQTPKPPAKARGP